MRLRRLRYVVMPAWYSIVMGISPEELGRRARELNAKQEAERALAREQAERERDAKVEEVRPYLQAFVEYMITTDVQSLPIFLRSFTDCKPSPDELWTHGRYPSKAAYFTYKDIGRAYELTRDFNVYAGDDGAYEGRCVSAELQVFKEVPARHFMLRGDDEESQFGYIVHLGDIYPWCQDVELASMHPTIEQTVIGSVALYQRGELPSYRTSQAGIL